MIRILINTLFIDKIDDFFMSTSIVAHKTSSDFTIHYHLLITFILLVVIVLLSLSSYKTKKKLKNLLEVDALTGLMSKYKFTQEAKQLLEKTPPGYYLLLNVDIDGFRNINKVYGHRLADELLKLFADTLFSSLSSEEIICRLQEDNFILLLVDPHNPIHDYEDLTHEDLQQYEESFQGRVKSSFEKGLKSLQIDLSIYFSAGIYRINDATEDLNYMIDCSELAKHHSKNTFGHSVTFFNDAFKCAYEKESAILSSTTKALKNKEFSITIQPKVNLQTGELVGGEVLIRWQLPDGSFLSPDEFIPLYEKNTFIIKLDRYIFKKACEFIESSPIELPIISVNISPITLLHRKFIPDYLSILDSHNLKPSQIEFELTESVLDADLTLIAPKISTLKNLGFSIAIDDFGKGASSLARVKELNLDLLKLDREFINDNAESEKGLVVLQNIISMANSLGIATLAEGIETKIQQIALIELGCDYGQGHLFDAALAPDVFIQRVLENQDKLFTPISHDKKIHKYWSNFEKLPYGVAIVANDPYSTIIKANSSFYNIIQYDKESFIENCSNRLCNISLDNLHDFIKKNLDEKVYLFEYDIRISNKNNEVLWLHEIVNFDLENNLFFITFIDTTRQNSSFDLNSSYQYFNFQKEVSRHINNHISDYIYITDIKTFDILYLNNTMAEYFGFKNEDEWLGLNLFKLAFDSDTPIDTDFYNTINADNFVYKEYYNTKLDKYFNVQVKLISIQGIEMRLHILKDITFQKKTEIDLAIQVALYNCIRQLYSSSLSDKGYYDMLAIILDFYGAERASYFTLYADNSTFKDVFTVTSDNPIVDDNYWPELPLNDRHLLFEIFNVKDRFLFSIEDVMKFPLSSQLKNIFKTIHARELIVAPIYDENDVIHGFIGISNPSKYKTKVSLIKLLSTFIGLYNNNCELKEFEKDALISEENSKMNLLNLSSTILHSNGDTQDSFNKVLKSLCKHYGASFCVVLDIPPSRDTILVQYQLYLADESIRFDKAEYSSAHPIMIEKIDSMFALTAQSSSAILSKSSAFHSDETQAWMSIGLFEAYFTPIYDITNKVSQLLVIGNPTLTTRSLTLLKVMSNFILAYNEKTASNRLYELALAQDPLTHLYNKIATENAIISLLQKEEKGTLFMIDIDNFKSINDSFGHITGDNVIKNIASCLHNIFRRKDIIGRVGGDEFMVFSPNLLDKSIIEQRANSILTSINHIHLDKNSNLCVTTSIGIYTTSKEGEDFQTLYRNADLALYRVKLNTKNNFCIY